jgi:phospholipase C
VRRVRRHLLRIGMVVIAAAGLSGAAAPAGTGQAASASTAIQHVVIIYQENHSFDNVLGKLCVVDARCSGATTGMLPNGSTISLTQATDLVPAVDHTHRGQQIAIAQGKMNGFGKLTGCTVTQSYACYSQFTPQQIPNLAALARAFAISDHTFEMDTVPSWGAHLELVAQQLDGFTGDNPSPGTSGSTGPGWGCDSRRDARWRASPLAAVTYVPSCVPDPALDPATYPNGGAYKPTPVARVPTIMDRLDAAGLSWRLYATGGSGQLPYGWAICPTFAECLDTNQHQHQVASGQVVTDAQNGALPNLSIVLPSSPNSQHNQDSMAQGDNWIGQVVSAIEHGPQWSSTAIFITYDDCGCFYDHLAPPTGRGIRVPMVIVSPYARAGYTDTTTASFSSMLAFTEHVFGLTPLASSDANAYDYANSFDFTQAPLQPAAMTHTAIPRSERGWLAAHPPRADDPT